MASIEFPNTLIYEIYRPLVVQEREKLDSICDILYNINNLPSITVTTWAVI